MNNNCKTFPKYTLQRLTDYLNILYQLKVKRTESVSSGELAKMLGITDVQVRKDLTCFDSIGKRGVGYDVNRFIEAIEDQLGLNKEYSVIIIGAGRLGTALMNYKRLSQAKFSIKAAFDISKEKIRKTINNVKIHDIDHLEEYLLNNETDIAVFTVPATEVEELYKIIEKSNVKAILNFTPSIVKDTENIIVRNLDIVSDFKILAYKIKEKNNADKNFR